MDRFGIDREKRTALVGGHALHDTEITDGRRGDDEVRGFLAPLPDGRHLSVKWGSNVGGDNQRRTGAQFDEAPECAEAAMLDAKRRLVPLSDHDAVAVVTVEDVVGLLRANGYDLGPAAAPGSGFGPRDDEPPAAAHRTERTPTRPGNPPDPTTQEDRMATDAEQAAERLRDLWPQPDGPQPRGTHDLDEEQLSEVVAASGALLAAVGMDGFGLDDEDLACIVTGMDDEFGDPAAALVEEVRATVASSAEARAYDAANRTRDEQDPEFAAASNELARVERAAEDARGRVPPPVSGVGI